MAKQRANGEGSIYFRKWNTEKHRGIWCGLLRVGKRRINVFGKTQSEVKEKLFELRGSAANGYAPTDGRKQTVESFLDAWLEATRPSVRPATYRQYLSHIRTHIKPKIGQIPIAKLSELHVHRLLSDMEAEGRSARLRQSVFQRLKSALYKAVKWRAVPRNVCGAIENPRAPRPEARALTPEEVRRFLDAATADRYFALYALAVTCGLRISELLALQWPDVDLQGATIAVRHTLTRGYDGKLALGEPKTKNSRRSVALPKLAVDALREHQKRLLATGLRASPWVFPNADGGPTDKDKLRARSFKRVCERAGLGSLKIHELRHTAGSLLIASGIHPRVVQERLGHDQIRTTLDTYAHILPTMQREAAKHLDDVLAPQNGGTMAVRTPS